MVSTRDQKAKATPELNVDTSSLSAEGKKIAAVIISSLSSYFETIIKGRDKEIDELRSTVQALEERVTKLGEEVDNADAYERRDMLTISGEVPAFTTGENTKNVVGALFEDKLRLKLQHSDISVAHRLGAKPKQQGPDKRPIIVKLCRRDLKQEILYACRQQKPNFYVNESLTPSRNTIMFALRKAKKKFPAKISFCRSYEGSINVYLPTALSNGPHRFKRVILNTRKKLEEFLTNELATSLRDLEVEWTSDQ